MKKAIYLFTALLFVTSLAAQKKLPDFGEITLEELKQSSCPIEPHAAAMKIFDVEETDFSMSDYGMRLKMETRVRIKIYNEKGYEHASIKIPYLSKRGFAKIKELKAIVYSLDASGKIVTEKLEKKDFYKEKASEYVGMVNFTFPNLKPGSVVEYSYIRIENDMFHLDPWLIQTEIPSLYSSLIITTPVSSLVKEKLFGSDTVARTTVLIKYDQFRRTTYFRENILSFKPEPFMSSKKDNQMKMIFHHIPRSNFMVTSLTASNVVWKSIGDYVLNSERLGGQIQKEIPGTQQIIDSAKRIVSMTDRIQFIYDTVRKSVPQKTEQTSRPEDILETWKNKAGNTADINVILLNLLAKSDVICYPILVSTRENGLISKDFPSMSQLNGLDVVAVADSSKYFILDASLKFQSFNTPPLNIMNREVLLLRPNNMDWFMVGDERPLLKQSINLFCEIKDNGRIEGEASLQHYNYAKSYILDTTIEDDDNKDEKYFDKKTQGLKILSTKRELTENEDDPLFENISFTYEPQQTDDYYFFNPLFLSSKQTNPFTAENRQTDIDFGCNQEVILTINMTIPPDFEVDHLPRSIIVRAPDSSFYFSRSYSVSAGNIFLSQVFSIKRPLFSKEEYAGLKESFQRMHALMNEEVVIRRKKK